MTNDDMSQISKAGIGSALAPYGVQLAELQLDQVRMYVSLLLRWNRSMNLTAVEDPIEIVSRHFGESLFVTTLLPMDKGRLADLGTGAGFPGLAIKIMQPGLQIFLIESNKKKCAFLSEAVRALNLSGVEILPERFEDIRVEENFADFVATLALGGFPKILRWSRQALSARGHILLWVGGEDISAITSAKGWIWNPPIRIPESLRRYILMGRYVGNLETNH